MLDHVIVLGHRHLERLLSVWRASHRIHKFWLDLFIETVFSATHSTAESSSPYRLL